MTWRPAGNICGSTVVWIDMARKKKDYDRVFDEHELRERLTKEQYHVTQKAGTERPYQNAYHDNKEEGDYNCVVCGEHLFSSDAKYDSGTGWPSFFAPVAADKIDDHSDRKLIIKRTENVCASCGAHLGHVFVDRSTPTKQRYCMNSASLDFVQAKAEDTNDEFVPSTTEASE